MLLRRMCSVRENTTNFKKLILFILCAWVLSLHICLYHAHTWNPQRPDEGIEYPEVELQMVMSWHVDSGN